jgi:hypothetical protein
LKQGNLNPIKVPHLKGLRVKDILLFAKQQSNVEDYLPEYKNGKTPNRDWL